VSGELGLRKYLESLGHKFVVTADKEGPNSHFERELPDAEIVISQPFLPAYLTAERIGRAKNLKIAITAGIGSDHVDLQAAIDHKITVAEVAYCNSKVSDVVTINAPLHPETENLFNGKLLAKMKRGAYLVNTARGKICDRGAIVRALESGQLAGYAGDVWFPQPARKDHPWRTMPHHGMTPHISGTSLSAQARYAAGTRAILECWFEKRPIRNEYLIVDGGKLAGEGAHSYSAGDAAKGSEEAAKFKSAS
jgi:lactate dehydrogenase-like 2-hydroxyacid dehydrogenase